MNIIVALYSAILFFILSPNIVVRFPSNGSKRTVAMVHAALFGIVLFFTQNIVHNLFRGVFEGLKREQSISPAETKARRINAASSPKGSVFAAQTDANKPELHHVGMFR